MPSENRLDHSIIPYLALKDAAAALQFYQKAFGAVEVYRIEEEGGVISHAEIRIGGAPVFVSSEFPEIGVLSPQAIGGSPVMIVIETPDVDALFHQAVTAGATVIRPLQDGFDGSLRTAKVNDPFGHRWMLVTDRSGQG